MQVLRGVGRSKTSVIIVLYFVKYKMTNTASLNVLLAILLWSSQAVVVRFSGVAPHVLIFYAGIVALVLQGTMIGFNRSWEEIADFRVIGFSALLGVFLFGNVFSYFYAFQHTTVANAVLTHYTAPVIVAFLSPIILREMLSLKTALAIAVASAGLWIMLGGFSFRALGEGDLAGTGAGLFSGLAYAIVIILVRGYARSINPLILTFCTNAAIVLLLAPFIREVPLKAPALWSFLIMGTVYSTIAPFLYYKGLRYVSATKAAVLGYLEPVAAIMLSMVFFGEMPGSGSLAGGLLIISAGYLTVREEGRRKKEAVSSG